MLSCERLEELVVFCKTVIFDKDWLSDIKSACDSDDADKNEGENTTSLSISITSP